MSDEPGQPITGIRTGDVGENVFLCGDPARVQRISAGWTEVESVVDVREYSIVRGRLDGLPVAAASHGIGAPSTAVLVEELAKTGAKNLIRIGNSGGLDPALELGDLVITTGAVRDDGTTRSYIAPEFPAVAHHRVVAALEDAALANGARFSLGVTWSMDAFYARNAVLDENGEIATMSFDGYTAPELESKLVGLRAARVQNAEMESGAILTLASLFGLRAGCICVVSDRAPWPGPSELDIDKNMARCIDVASDAMLRLVRV